MPFKTEKAWDVLWSVIRTVDLIIEVLDARNPNGTRSREIEDFIKQREKEHRALLLVLNKVDLVPRDAEQAWVQALSNEHAVVATNARRMNNPDVILKAIRAQLSKIPALSKPEVKHHRILVVGYPNSGKSTLIQSLTRNKKKLGISSQAGHTRGIQTITLADDLYLVDTPGVIPVSQSEEEIHQALDTCSISPQKIVDKETVFDEIAERTGIENLNVLYATKAADTLEFVEMLGKARGLLKKGGDVNEEQVHDLLIRDWQRNRIPFYYLPDPENPTKRGLPRIGKIRE